MSTIFWLGPSQVCLARTNHREKAGIIIVAYAGSDQFMLDAVTGNVDGNGRKTSIQHVYNRPKALTNGPEVEQGKEKHERSRQTNGTGRHAVPSVDVAKIIGKPSIPCPSPGQPGS